MAILTEIKDPRVRDVTVTRVEVAPDMRSAKVYVSVMGDDAKTKLSLRGLESSAGFLQTKVAKRIDTRYTPRISFVIDEGVKKSLEIMRILQEVLPKKDETEDEGEGEFEGENEVMAESAEEQREDEASKDENLPKEPS